jgi:peptidyl-prolyl cis-trans isomerase D
LFLDQRRKEIGVMDDEKMKAVKFQVMQELVRESVFLAEADKYGITVTDNELAQYIQSIPAFQTQGKFDQRAYMQALVNVVHMSP